MPVVQSVLRHSKFAVGVKHNQVCIVAWGDATLMRIATSKASRALRHPTCEIEEIKTSVAGPSPHQRQSDGETGNPAPSCSKITLVEPLHRRKAGRVVGDHHIDGSISQALPQSLAILAAANGRRTLAERCPVGNRFGRE